jgi:hypothetical protein
MNRLSLVLALGLLAGCASVRPDALTASYIHQSSPFNGPHGPPIGNHERTDETRMDGVQLGAEWTGERYFGDFGCAYAVSSNRLAGAPWTCTARAGVRVRLP